MSCKECGDLEEISWRVSYILMKKAYELAMMAAERREKDADKPPADRVMVVPLPAGLEREAKRLASCAVTVHVRLAEEIVD